MEGGRKYAEIECDSWRTGDLEYEVEQTSMPWAPRHVAPIQFGGDKPAPSTPAVAPPLINNQESTALRHREATIHRRARSGNASYPSIRFDWIDTIYPALTHRTGLLGRSGRRLRRGEFMEYSPSGRPPE